LKKAGGSCSKSGRTGENVSPLAVVRVPILKRQVIVLEVPRSQKKGLDVENAVTWREKSHYSIWIRVTRRGKCGRNCGVVKGGLKSVKSEFRERKNEGKTRVLSS